MALAALDQDAQRIVFVGLCNPLEPWVAVNLSSASRELRGATQALQQQLRVDHEATAALCRKTGMQNCKELREAKVVDWDDKGLTAAELALLGTLGSVLPALAKLCFIDNGLFFNDSPGAAGLDGVQRLADGLGAGALPAVTRLHIGYMHVGDAGAEALAAALGRGALPRLEILALTGAGISDAALVALAPALRRLPALERLRLGGNPFGDEGLAALLAPPPPAGTPPPPAGGLKKLKDLNLSYTQITDAGCAALASALNSGVLPALETLGLHRTLASTAAIDAVSEALAKIKVESRGVVLLTEDLL